MTFRMNPVYKSIAYRVCEEKSCQSIATRTVSERQLCEKHANELTEEEKEKTNA